MARMTLRIASLRAAALLTAGLCAALPVPAFAQDFRACLGGLRDSVVAQGVSADLIASVEGSK